MYTVINGVEHCLGRNFSVAPANMTGLIYWWIEKGIRVNHWGETFETLRMTHAVDRDEPIRVFSVVLAKNAEPFPLIWEDNVGLRTFELQNSQVIVNNLHQVNNANVCSFCFAHVEPNIINDAIAAFGGGVAPVALMRAPSLQLIEQPALEVAQTGEEGIGAESLTEDAVNGFDSSHQMVLTKEGDTKLTSTSAAVGETALDVADKVEDND